MRRVLGARWQVWSGLNSTEKTLLLPSWLLLGFARLLILLLPFSRLSRLLGQSLPRETAPPALTAAQGLRAASIGRAVGLAARHTPWASQCQAQALVARFWLACFGIPYLLCYGARRNSAGKLDAHAWICCADQVITGADEHRSFALLAVYGRR